ncbi:glycosyltransferase 87 family protein [Halosegnis marinus]|uniref:glycosyltransferase 87 family protein n=1 Tax=Halosegnis marinus TaxID=3034023 RepID=UPI00360847E3
MKLGQVSTFVAAGFAFAFVAGERAGETGSRGWRYLSGGLTTLTAGIKPYYLTSGAHLLRDRVRLVGALAVGLAAAGLSLAVFGIDTHLRYLDVLLWGKGWTEPPLSLVHWHPGYFEPLAALGNVTPLLSAVARAGVVVGTVAVTLAARDARDPATRWATFGLGVAVFPLVAPTAYTQDLVVLLVPAVLLAGVEYRRGGRPWLPLLAVGLVHVHAYVAFAVSAWHADAPALATAAVGVLQPAMWGAFLLVGLAAARTAEAAGRGPFA